MARKPRAQGPLAYKLAHWILNTIFFFWGFKVEGLENLPEKGGVILAGNHSSYLDPPVLGSAVDRQVHFMAKIELFHIPVLAPMIKEYGAFPVVRGKPDRKALKKAGELLSEGEVVGIFPEGRRQKSGEIGEAEPGTALIALRNCVPVVPIVIKGTNKFPFQRIRVRLGRPLMPPESGEKKIDKVTLENFSNLIKTSLEDLYREME
ncbi:MAG: 1-acyl-sn-glycerol-3-phosphate acyltransferase [Chloroflexi bacterium]|nr:1-acyl-sn-glycerol-3-phosphate acyltransferase [Chloroflexota bacterium]